MRKLLLSVILVLMSTGCRAISAYPYKIPQMVNGKLVYIRLFGDEHCKWAESEDGHTIVRNEHGEWSYAQLGSDSTLTATPWTLDKGHLPEAKDFLMSVPKHLVGRKEQQKEESVSTRKIKPAIGKRRMLIILMSYLDLPLTKSQEDFRRLFNEEGYSEDGAKGSVRDFYLSASYHQLELQSDIYGPYTAEHNMSYYGRNSGRNNNDVNAYSLFEEAITKVAANTDLQQYDGDGDGFIDNVHIIFAGYGEEAGAAADAIWSHEATFYRPYEIQGLKIDRYSCAPELRGNSGGGISRIGPHCHEIGHALGAMDFYDTDYATGGSYLGTGKWDVMASGSWNNDGITPADFNPYVKAFNYGWISPKVLPKGEVTISPSHDDAESYYILKPDEYSDYYLLENRSKERWGAGLPGAGLLIFHIHSDLANAANEINATAPQMCYVVCASAQSKLPGNTPASYGDINSDGCPFPGRTNNTDFGQSSTPKAFYWDGTECGIEINNIALDSQGNIVLTNNSDGASYETKEWTSLFFEGFEGESTVIDGKEPTAWTIEDNPENTMAIVSKPIAYEGVRSLQLSAQDTGKDMSDTLEFHCTVSAAGKIRLKICAAPLHLRFNKPNIVSVGYRIADNPDWNYTEIAATENNRWRQTIIDLPDRVDGSFRIIGKAFSGSILAIDNIEVEQEIQQETAVSNIIKSRSNIPSIYSITGQKRSHLRSGLNIISDGTIKKIIVK